MAQEKKEIAKQAEGGALSALDDDLFLQDAGKGSEDVQVSDLIVPFVRILQDLSAQVKKSKPEYIEGAEAGMFFNTATQELYSGQDGIFVVPIKFQTRYTEWVPRTAGGGLVADHGDDASVLNRCEQKDNKYTTPEGNEIVEAGTFWCYLVNIETGAYQGILLSFSGTQRKKGRRWNTMIKSLQVQVKGKPINPASFYQTYKLTSVPETNDKGDWYGYRIESHCPTVTLPNGTDIYMSAREFLESIASGKIQAAAAAEDHSDDSVDLDKAPI